MIGQLVLAYSGWMSDCIFERNGMDCRALQVHMHTRTSKRAQNDCKYGTLSRRIQSRLDEGSKEERWTLALIVLGDSRREILVVD
jgi:hypothetical protein